MFNTDKLLEDKFELIVNVIKLLNKKKKILRDKELIEILLEVYDQIIPETAKPFLPPHKFLQACLERKERILAKINYEQRRQFITVLE